MKEAAKRLATKSGIKNAKNLGNKKYEKNASFWFKSLTQNYLVFQTDFRYYYA